MKRLIAIGDVHASSVKLRNLLNQLQITEEDTVVFLGDLCDRGEDSVGVLDTVTEVCNDFPNTVLILGNHSHMLFHDKSLWLMNGGKATQDSFRKAGKTREDYNHIWNRMVLKHKVVTEARTYYFSHAGWELGRNLEEQFQEVSAYQEDILLWTREHIHFPELAKQDWTDGTAVFGHTIIEEPVDLGYMVAIDTGAFHEDRPLTAAILPVFPGEKTIFVQSA